MRGWFIILAWGVIGGAAARAQEAAPAATAAPAAAATPVAERPVETVLETQIELHRRGFSCGSIDGVAGAQTAAALKAFQRANGIRESGILDAATRELLVLRAPALAEHTFSEEELAALRPVPATWLEKSQQPALAFATALELAGERYRAHPKLLQQINAAIVAEDWATILPGTTIVVPNIPPAPLRLGGGAAQIVIRLALRELEVVDADSRVLAHFPVSIARSVEKRPVGELKVKVVAPEPNYTFDPEVFPESAEAKELGRKLILPPGPNNPVGRAWIGLDRPGYGIHGTPDPEKVGRTESHGCFRLANWDAVTLLSLVRVGMPVLVEP